MRISAEYTVHRAEEAALMGVPQSSLAEFVKGKLLIESIKTVSQHIEMTKHIETSKAPTGELAVKTSLMFHVFTEATYQNIRQALRNEDLTALRELLKPDNI